MVGFDNFGVLGGCPAVGCRTRWCKEIVKVGGGSEIGCQRGLGVLTGETVWCIV